MRVLVSYGTAASMPRFIVLILMTLGLQVPGGLAFRVCLCDGLFGGASSHCHETLERVTCCDGGVQDRTREHAQCASQDRCRCVLVHVPEQPASKVLHSGPMFTAWPPRVFNGIQSFLDPSVGTCERVTSRGQDPPWQRANVPLRI